MKNLYSINTIILLILFSANAALYPVSKEKQTITVSGHTLDIKEAIKLVLQNNLNLRAAKYDVIMSDTAPEAYQKKYAPVLEAEAGYQKQKMPASGNTVFSGDTFFQWQISTSISKLFSTGTMVSAGIKENWADSNDEEFGDPAMGFYKPEDPALHKPSLFFSIRQELLKNSFGYSEQKMREILENRAEMQKEALLSQLATLVVGALVDYWQVSIQKSALKNARLQLESTKNIRNIITRNSRLGLAEKFDLNQYNSLVSAAESRVFLAEQMHKEALRKLLRTVNLPPETEISGVTNLTYTLPDILSIENSLEAAYKKRADYKNAEREIQTAKLEQAMHENNALPSVSANFSISTAGQDEDFSSAIGSSLKAEYPAWQASLKMSYPLWDKELKTNSRNAALKLKQSKIRHEQLTVEIRDDVLSKLERVKLQYKVLNKIINVREESEKYYDLLLKKTKQGRFNSIALKNALDSIFNAKQQELEALVQYNVSLLQFDLAKNEIFEKYEINIEELISKVE
ncbi:MAG: TolC family protein [Spirochaetia bacterium]|nr:TolC family protein [Spirochaetia bacterium]